MKAITTENAPAPGGHYSQAVAHDGWVFVSGQLPIDPRTGERNLGPIEAQAALALANVVAIVEAAGSSRDRIVRTTAYVTDIALWGKVNEVYQAAFPDHRPARSVVPVKELHHGFLVEIDAVAVL